MGHRERDGHVGHGDAGVCRRLRERLDQVELPLVLGRDRSNWAPTPRFCAVPARDCGESSNPSRRYRPVSHPRQSGLDTSTPMP